MRKPLQITLDESLLIRFKVMCLHLRQTMQGFLVRVIEREVDDWESEKKEG